jgi:hypothetical protein
MYYRHDGNYLLIEKSKTPLTGENVLTCDDDIDIDMFRVIVAFVEAGKILRYTKLAKSAEELIKYIGQLKEQINPTFNEDTATLDELKEYRIKKSRENQKAYLDNNPVFSTCHNAEGGYYTITEEKQGYLQGIIFIAQMKQATGAPYQPSWNETGKSCTYDWTLEQLVQLSFEIEEKVRPIVSQQQKMEDHIKAATTKEEVLAISIEFGGDSQ